MESDRYSYSSRSEYSEESVGGSPRGHPVIDSTSYTVPGNPLAHLYENRLTPFSQIEPLAPIRSQRSLIQQEIHAEASSHKLSRRSTPVRQEKDHQTSSKPLAPIPRQKTLLHQEIHADSSSHRLSRRDSPSRRENDTRTPQKRNREKKSQNEFRLPEIVPNDYLRSEDIIDGLSKDGLLPDSRFIRHTRSGIAYHYMYGPPVRRPRRLPRIVSEGAVVPGGRKEKFLVDSLDYRARSPRKQMNQCYCSGGMFTEDIRCAVNNSRQKREQKHTERFRNQQQQQDRKLAMLARGQGSASHFDERAARVQEVRAKQDEIRQQEARRAMENFMKQKKRK